MKPAPILGPEQTQEILDQVLPEVNGVDARLEGWTSDTQFTEHGKKRVVRYDLRVRVAKHSYVQQFQWVGKHYELEAQALLVASILRTIGRSECARIAGLVVPTVLAYHSSSHLLFLTYEPGESLTTAMPRENEAILKTTGRALAALHGMKITPPNVTSPATVLAELRWRVEDLSTWLQTGEPRLGEAFARLEAQAPESPSNLTFVHNDFGPANLLWRAPDLIVLDFDKCALGDAAIDLGNFLVQLRRRSIIHPDRFGDFASSRNILLQEYGHWCTGDRGLESRVSWYEHAILLRKAHRLWLEGRNNGSEEGARHIADAQLLLSFFLEDLTLKDSLPDTTSGRPLEDGTLANREGNRRKW